MVYGRRPRSQWFVTPSGARVRWKLFDLARRPSVGAAPYVPRSFSKRRIVALRDFSLPPMMLAFLRHGAFKGATKTKYKFGSLKRRLYPDDNDTDFIANVKQITEIWRKTDEAVATHNALSGNFSMTSQNFVCAIGGRRPKPAPRNMTGRL